VVAPGVTELVPELTATEPIPWSMVTLVALLTVQLKVELPPGSITFGVAVKELIVGPEGMGPPQPNKKNNNNKTIESLIK